MRPAPPGPALLRGVAPHVDVRREVGKREACGLASLVFFFFFSVLSFLPEVLESFPNPLVLTGLEETSTLLSTIAGVEHAGARWRQKQLGPSPA